MFDHVTIRNVDAFWRAGVDAGHPSDGEPGPRPVYGPVYHGGFLLDPQGNSVEAVHHGDLRKGTSTTSGSASRSELSEPGSALRSRGAR